MACGCFRRGAGHDTVIGLPAGTQIWVAAGATDMRKGFDTLCAIVQETLKEDVYSGQLFVFRGKRGDRVKILWWCDGGLCLFYRRLEEGHFTWPRATSGVVSLSSAQLSMLLEGIDWRRPVRTTRPQLSV
jgi:transposase